MESRISFTNRIEHFADNPRIQVLIIWLLATLPRVVSLKVFLTADEDDQLWFASRFLEAMLNRNWSEVLVLGYPGVPTMAMSAFGLWIQDTGIKIGHALMSFGVQNTGQSVPPTYVHHIFLPLVQNSTVSSISTMVAEVRQTPLDYIVAARLPLAIVAGIAIAVVFVLLRKLLSTRVAFLATLVIAFDPFFLANTRVIHVDAPLTYFMLISFLAFLVYLSDGQWRYLMIAGVSGGGAFLSKSPAALLLPILVVAGFSFAWTAENRQGKLKRLWVGLFGWGILLGVSFFAFFPAMWTRPLFTLDWIFKNAMSAFNAPHPSSGLFWNNWITDRSPWYYTVILPFLLTPLTTIGLFLAAIFGVKSKGYSRRALAFASMVFVVLFIFAVSLASKRLARYILPAFPLLDLLAVLGWVWFIDLKKQWRRWGQWILAGLILAQILFVISFHPYYFQYANPLTGGAKTAPKFMVMGWGEGLDQAANYLNQKPNAEKLGVAAWYSWQFAPYFSGKTVDLASNEPAYTADYTVFYLNQIQRQFPSKELLDYFADRVPEKVITLKGIDYIWIYPGPIIGEALPAEINHPTNLPLNEAISLQGIDHRCDGTTAATCPITLYWQATAPLPADLNVSIRAVDEAGMLWGQVDRLPIGGVIRTDKWEVGSVIRDEYKLHLDPAMPAGNYTFDILLYDFKSGDVFAKASHVASLNVGELSAGDDAFYDYQARGDFMSVEMSKGLTLENHTFKNYETLPGYPRYFKSYWQSDEDASVQFIARQGDTELSVGASEISASGRTHGQTNRIVFPADAPAGEYEIFARVKGGTAKLGAVTLLAQSHNFKMPIGIERTGARFGEAIVLAGYELSADSGTIDLKLYWQPESIPSEDLKVFVHLTDAAGNIIAQRDAIPAGGGRPTQTWVTGEVIADEYRIPVDGQVESVWVGMYNPLTGERVTVSSDNLPVSDNRLRIN